MTYPFVQSPNRRHPRRASVVWVTLHTTESDIGGSPDRGAENTASYFTNSGIDVSSHYVTDDDSTVQCVDEGDEAWTNAPWNPFSITIEQDGRAAWSRDYWLANHDGLLNQTAALVADICTRHSIPIRRVTPVEVAAAARGGGLGMASGVITHVDLNTAARALGKSYFQGLGYISSSYSDSSFFGLTSHTDCGAGYPIDVVLDRAAAHASPTVAPEEDDTMPYTIRPRGYANQFVVGTGGCILPASAELLAKLAIDVNAATVFTHRALLISLISQSGLTSSDLQRAGEPMPPEHVL